MTAKDDAVRTLHRNLDQCWVALKDWTCSTGETTEAEAEKIYKECEPFLFYYGADEPFLTPKIVSKAEVLKKKFNNIRTSMSPLPDHPSVDNDERKAFYKRRRECHKRLKDGDIAKDVEDLKELLGQHIEEPAVAEIRKPHWIKRALHWILEHIIAAIIVGVVGGVIVAIIVKKFVE